MSNDINIGVNMSTCTGFKVSPDGEVTDFKGTVNRAFSDLRRANAAIRRKYKDSSITITNIEVEKHHYSVPFDQFIDIATQLD